MNRRPIPPASFVPVDSLEACAIDGNQFVNVARVKNGVWEMHSDFMREVRKEAIECPDAYYHVQTPMPLEFYKVWEYIVDDDADFVLRRHGKDLGHCILGCRDLDEETVAFIVDCLNKREEERDGRG